MSTLSGNATKGEKGKRYQQLKINLHTANKPTEPEQQQPKSSLLRKQNGMTALGKVPTARRPTNLPSEKSEHSGNDPSVNLVPSGGAGWGNKQNETGPNTTPSLVQSANPPTNVPVNNVPLTGTSQQVPHAQHYPPVSRMPPLAPQVANVPVHHGHTDVKTWAKMTHGVESSAPNFLAPQSPLFQHEFPSLSSSSETSSATTPVTATATQKPTANTITDTQYGPGPSLRPQTEGSWIQGGGRPQGSMGPPAGSPPVSAPAQVRPTGPYPPHIGPDGARNNLAPSGVGVAPGGPYPPVVPMMPPHFNGMMPQFMLRNSYPPGSFPPNFQAGTAVKPVGPRPPYGSFMPSGPHSSADNRFMPAGAGANSSKRSYDDEDVKIRSIIKEEDLNQMASIGNDIGWAGHEDIDYNQKLKFSDDEDDDKSKDNRGKSRGKQTASKGDEKAGKRDSAEKENELKSSKESLKDREKLYSTEQRTPEIRNAWQMRRNIITPPTPPSARYQIPANGQFEDDDDALQEKRRQKKEEMDIIVQRAKERKEEEEKRFIEQHQKGAALKLRQLNAQIAANESGNKEAKSSYPSEREIDMLPEWEKEKYRLQNRSANENLSDEARKLQNAALVPVVKDASEFRELTKLVVERSTVVKKEVKERETSQQGVFSRAFSSNIPPRFQNTNRQNSGTFSSGSSSSGPTRSTVTQSMQYTSKSVSSSLTMTRHVRADSESLSDKDRDWNAEDSRKDHDADRYVKEPVREREREYYGNDDDRKYETKSSKEYDMKRKYYGEKDEYSNDASNRDFEREPYYSSKMERNNSESERDKPKSYDNRRYSGSESPEKEIRRRTYDEPEKSRSYGPSRSPRTFSESENHERKKSREETVYENSKPYNPDRDYYRKGNSHGRDNAETDHYSEKERRDTSFAEYKKEMEAKRELSDKERRDAQYAEYKKEVDAKRDREYETKREKDTYKEQDRRSPGPYDDRLTRSELHGNRFHRESRESLREEPYSIQDSRSYSWADDADVDEKKVRREHFREDRGDRYSHPQRHIPGPITRAKLEAKEMEADSKRNLTALVKSDKKTEIKKSESEDAKDKEKSDKSVSKTDAGDSSSSQQKSEQQTEVQSAWKKEEKKENDEAKATQSSNTASEQNAEKSDSLKEKDDGKKEAAKSSASKESQGDKSSDEKRRKAERRKQQDPRNWTSFSNYHTNSYGRHGEPKRRSNRGPSMKTSIGRDSKYSESELSDDVLGSGREDRSSRGEDRSSRGEREKMKPMKVKRYDRDDRNRDYRVDDREYGGNRGRNRDYYYGKPPQRGRGSGFRSGGSIGKRIDGYGPPPAKSPFGPSGSEDKRQKSSSKESNAVDQNAPEKKVEPGKTSSRSAAAGDRSWKKSSENAQSESKSAVSSPTSTQTAEANEESFATASEGSDSEDTAPVQKPKPTYVTTKRAATVVAAKPQRKSFRSTSRKRYENRRAGPLYSRKDSGSYSSGPKRNPPSGTTKPSSGNKEHGKLNDEQSSVEYRSAAKDDSKVTEKPSRDYGDSQSRKNVKSRNRSNSRKNPRTSSSTGSGRAKAGQDGPPRLQTKQKSTDGKSGDYKEPKGLDISTSLFREVGPPIPAPPPAGNAWDKPLTGALRTASPSTQRPNGVGSATGPASGTTNMTTTVIVQEKKSIVQITEQHNESSTVSSDLSSSTVSAEKVTTKVLENLDGSTPPARTIIFENTNFKSGPSDISSKSKYSSQLKSHHRFEKDSKLDGLESNVSNFGNDSSTSDLPNSKHDPLQMLPYKNEDVADMDFNFDSPDFSKLADDNSKSAKQMELTHAIHLLQASTDADLNLKIASCKKVWDGSVEHYDDKYDGGMVNTSASFSSPSFSSHGPDPNMGACYSHVENSGHVQVDDVGALGHNEVVFSPVSQIQGVNAGYGPSAGCQTVGIKNDNSGSSSNVCKVKPQPQGCGNLVNAAQSSVISTTLVSQPPPMSSPSYTFSCSTPQPNLSNGAVAASALAQMNFQAAQYSSIPPVPSSPVLFNSSQTAAPAPAALYPTFQIDNSQVTGRSQFGQFTSYGLTSAIGQTSAFNQQSVFVQPPPSGPPPEMYTPHPQYRLQPQPYGNTQQITSPNTVLISSSTNSLMSATIKPSAQQIGAIGTKAGFQPAFLPFDPNAATQLLNQSYLPSSPLIQRPASNVVQAAPLQASTSYYNSASGGGQPGFFPGSNSALQPQAGTAMGLAAFNAQSATSSLPTIQNFTSQLTQPYRSAPASYLKSSGNTSSLTADFGNSKTMTIPNQHDVLSSAYQTIYFTDSQMTANKQRLQPGGKNMQNVPQGMNQHSMSQNAYNYPPSNQMRNSGSANKGSQYPHPIQRPVSQGNSSNRGNGGGSNTNNPSASHRMPVRNNSHQLVNNIQQPPSSVYYSASSGYSTGTSKLEASQLDTKAESSADAKLADSIKTMNAKNSPATTDKSVVSSNE